jgi:protein-tyrosine phosphatase
MYDPILHTQNPVNWIQILPMTQYEDRLYLGCMRDATTRAWLEEAGITAVCNLTQDDYPPTTPNYLYLNQLDGEYVRPQTIDRFVGWMRAQHRRGETILIHCHAGISRTSSFAIFWTMLRDCVSRDADLLAEWSAREDRMKQFRRIIEPHWKLKKSLLRWYEANGPF